MSSTPVPVLYKISTVVDILLKRLHILRSRSLQNFYCCRSPRSRSCSISVPVLYKISTVVDMSSCGVSAAVPVLYKISTVVD